MTYSDIFATISYSSLLMTYSDIFKYLIEDEDIVGGLEVLQLSRVLFENRPALYFSNYIFITAHKLYNFGFRIKDTVKFFIANNNNYDSNNENIAP